MNRTAAFELMCEHTKSDSLRRHMLAVEVAMRAYATELGQEIEKWGIVGLLHDFDYEKYPTIPDHPLKGSEILLNLGYPEDVIYAIKSHVNQLPDHPRVLLLDKYLFGCDELCGFLTACAYVRPEGIRGLTASSVRKKLKQKSFAATVSREDIANGANEIGVDLDEHVQFVIHALEAEAESLKLTGNLSSTR